MTEMLQKNENVANENSQDLTEKWKKGELPVGEYYLLYKDGTTDREYYDWANVYGRVTEKGFSTDPNDIEKILAEVPSYEEYMILVSYKEELTKLCKMKDKIIKKYEDIDDWWRIENQKLKERNDSLNNRDINLCRIANGIREENFELKELLKRVVNATDFYHEIKTASVVDHGVWYNIVNEINQVLGEDK